MREPIASPSSVQTGQWYLALCIAASATVVGLGLLVLVYRYYAQEFVMYFFFNADALYLPELFRDVVFGSSAWKDWHLTPAPYFFPDMPLYLISYISNSDPYHAVPIFFCFQILVTAILLFLVFASFYRLVNAALITGATISLYLFFLATGVPPLSYALVSGFHYGAFIGWIAGYLLMLRLLHAAGLRHFLCWVLLAVLVALTTLSDRLFVVQFTAPSIAAAVYLWIRRALPLHRAVSIGMACIVGTGIGFVLARFVIHNKTAYNVKLGVEALGGNAVALAGILRDFAVAVPAAAAMAIVFYAVCLAVLGFQRRLQAAGSVRIGAPLLLLVALASASAAASVAVLLLMTNLPVTDRYMIPMLTAPILLLPVLSTMLDLGGRAKTATVIAAAALLSTVPLLASRIPYGAEIRSAWYPEIVQCVDRLAAETGLRNGLAQYWHAKPILVFSREGVVVSQYVGALEPMPWISNSRRYAQAYDFAIVEPGPAAIDRGHLLSVAGEPSNVVPCGNAQILVYGKDGLKMPPASRGG
ncbi:MAG TPA: hypothetical protein VEY95_01020 [Azospirillaceae bacterium]|nr:hypothetical protein [Azospirillaceae bacterium]